MANTNCFAYNETESKNLQCCALTERICNDEYCRFYKTWDECPEDVKKLIKEQKKEFKKREAKEQLQELNKPQK